jgi:(4-(4-[2-(gamma-L-glutamylamino)ethyl]phenoxymethyl)furan-2-yl)methanamine synthase
LAGYENDSSMSDEAISESRKEACLALYVGGANLKGCHGGGASRTSSFEVWRMPERLSQAIGELAEGFPSFERIALTMTAELCDCYATKAEGVNAVLDAVAQAFPGFPVAIWGIDGTFHGVDEVRERPLLAAAANWLALATAAARLVRQHKALLIDIGSTTTDLIPLDQGKVAAIGRSDTERLRTGELVYAGVRRTPVCALATELPFRGQLTGLAAELFATTLDVFLMLGEIDPDPADLSTADGSPATLDCARDRLARMVGADRDGFSEDDAKGLARSAAEGLMSRLEACAYRVCENTIGRPDVVVVSGAGEFLARRVARSILGERLGLERFPSESVAPSHSHRWASLRSTHPTTFPSESAAPGHSHPPYLPFARGGKFVGLASGGKDGGESSLLSLAEAWGAQASTAACACALLLLASEASSDHPTHQD